MNDIEALTRKTLAEINPNLSVVKFQTLDEQIAQCARERESVQGICSDGFGSASPVENLISD